MIRVLFFHVKTPKKTYCHFYFYSLSTLGYYVFILVHTLWVSISNIIAIESRVKNYTRKKHLTF